MIEDVAVQHRVSVLNVIGGLVGGGAERQCLALAAGLPRDRFEVEVLYLIDDPSYIRPDWVRFTKITRRFRGDAGCVYRTIARAIRSASPSVVHAWYPEIVSVPAALCAKRFGIPLLTTQRHRLGGGVPMAHKVRDWLGCFAHAMADRIVTNYPIDSEPGYFRWMFGRKHGVVIPNAVLLRRETPRTPYGECDSVLRIVFVGRLAPQKRVNRLIEAVRDCAARGLRVEVDIIGRGVGDNEAELRDLASRLGVNHLVRFCGYLAEWEARVDRYDALVLPSVVEGMPNVVIEAMANGVPVIACAIPEIRGFVGEDDAILVQPDSSEALADAFSRLIGNCDLKNSLRRRGIQLARGYSGARMIQSYEDLYRNMCTSRRSTV